MTAFPTIHYLDAQTFKEASEDAALKEAPMDGGYVISRPAFTRRPRRMFSFDFKLVSDADKATLQNFWNSMYGSANAFTWTHPVTSEVINVRFSSTTKMEFQRIGFGPRNVWQTGTITLQEI